MLRIGVPFRHRDPLDAQNRGPIFMELREMFKNQIFGGGLFSSRMGPMFDEPATGPSLAKPSVA